MGLIEELRRRRAEEEARVAREEARVARQKAEAEEQERKRLQEIAIRDSKNHKEREASMKALQSSVVPQIAREFASLLHKEFRSDRHPSRAQMTMLIESRFEIKNRRHNIEEWIEEEKVLVIEGQIDGSVKIGNSVLSANGAQTPTVVEAALEAAYRHPTFTRSIVHTGEKGTYGGAWEDGPKN